MAAGDVTHILTDMTTKGRIEYKLVATNGTTGIVLSHGLANINAAFATWAEDIGATACSIEIAITDADSVVAIGGNVATLTCSGAVTKNCYVMLIGS